MRIDLRYPALILGLLCLLGYIAPLSAGGKQASNFHVERIAHAGGGYQGKTYTNFYEALDLNLSQGFRYFEIDFVFTGDQQLVCLHDWGKSFERRFKRPAKPIPTLAEFEKLAADFEPYTPCTLKGLAAWMKENPEAYIVSDVKGKRNNMPALEKMLAVLPDARRRLIPQIYQPEEYQPARDMGFEQIIWTLYRFPGDRKSVLTQLEKMEGAIAVTMPLRRAESSLPKKLAGLQIPTYVHTINDIEQAQKLVNELLVSEIYTDFLPPQ